MDTEHDQQPGAVDRTRQAAADPDRPTPQVLAALREMPTARSELDQVEIGLIEVLMDRGLGWDALATALDAPSGDALRVRYRRLGGSRSWPTGPRSTR